MPNPDNVIQIPAESTRSDQSVDIMVGEVAKLLGGDDDPDARNRAVIFLDRASDWMNSCGVYLYGLKETTFTSFTDGQSTLTLPSDWGWPYDRGWSYKSNQERNTPIEWVSWEQFQMLRETTDTSASRGKRFAPSYISIKSENDGTASIYPYISTTGATTIHSIRLAYIARIDRPGEVTSLSITPETREALIVGGQALAMQYRHSNEPRIWRPWTEMFERAIDRARASAFRRKRAEHWWVRVDVAPIPTNNIGWPYGWRKVFDG